MISIIGSGRVGSTIGFLCVSNALDDVLLINRSKDKAIGESLDVANAIPSSSKFSIRGTNDYAELSGSDIVVIAASTVSYKKSRIENKKPQIEMVKEIAKKIKEYCPSSIVLMISNPVDVLTYFFQKESEFSRFKVIGIASSLDSSRFRYFISEKLSVPQSSISNAMVLGEHGDTMVPVFSNVTVDGTSLTSMINNVEKKYITYDLQNYWKTLRNYKSRSQFGIAKNTYDVINTIIHAKELCIPASVVLEGEYGEDNVAMGVPGKISQNGIFEIQKIELDDYESKQFRESSNTIKYQINSV